MATPGADIEGLTSTDRILNQAGKVMALEHEIKQTHLVLLVRQINMMSPTQLEMLKEFRKSWRPKNPDRAQGDK